MFDQLLCKSRFKTFLLLYGFNQKQLCEKFYTQIIGHLDE